jgi:predicted AAA+ superfamily ATPase
MISKLNGTVKRTEFINQLIGFKDKELIKVITGIRRCGKSTLLDLYKEYLTANGVSAEQIIEVNFEDVDYEYIDDYKKLHSYIKSQLTADKMNYIFLDEIQHVDKWEKAVDSLYIKKNCDVYITGSNAYLLSGELSTLISGRYVEIKMFPLSFSEYMSAFPKAVSPERKYNDYLKNSSFPYTLKLSNKKEINAYLEGLYDSIVLKDVVARYNISNVAMLESVIKFIFNNIGNLSSTKSIADTMTSNGRKISTPTVETYLTALCESLILYKVERYDIKGKDYLKTGDKYYLTDIGLRYLKLGGKDIDYGHILENVIAVELLRRGYRIGVGKVNNTEVDFVAVNENGTEYYQIAYTARDENTLERELKPLDSINDHNPKYLLTMDNEPVSDFNGIKKIYALDWLLN